MTVTNVEQAIIAELKTIVSGLMWIAFLLKRIDEQRASAAANKTATSLPYIKMIRKKKVSETEMWPLMRGILTVRRELIVIVKIVSARKRMSSRATGRWMAE